MEHSDVIVKGIQQRVDQTKYTYILSWITAALTLTNLVILVYLVQGGAA